MGASPEGLQAYAEPLSDLMDFAPSGFPSQKDLRDAFALLQNKWAALGEQPDPATLLRALNTAADHWRIMTNHFYDIKVHGVTTPFPDVNELVAKVAYPP